jgi:hypothetical protein
MRAIVILIAGACVGLTLCGCTATGGGWAQPATHPTTLLPIVPGTGQSWPEPAWVPNVGSHDTGTVLAEAGKQATYTIPELLDERAVRIPVKAGAGLLWGVVEVAGRPREYGEALERARIKVQDAMPMLAWFEPYGIDNRNAVGARVTPDGSGVEITRYTWAGSWVPESPQEQPGYGTQPGYGSSPPPPTYQPYDYR